jgi:hypothetical protein
MNQRFFNAGSRNSVESTRFQLATNHSYRRRRTSFVGAGLS